MTSKYAGVTLDWYDDKGATLKARFPTVDALPQVIKEAGIRPKEKLAHEDFALVAVDEGHVMRKYACHDPGTTAMSVIYFMEHGDKLPEGAQKLAASNLLEACRRYEFVPPEALEKAAAVPPEVAKMLLGAGVGAGIGGVGAGVGGNPNTRTGRILTGAATGAIGGAAGGTFGRPLIGAGIGGAVGGKYGRTGGYVTQRTVDKLRGKKKKGKEKKAFFGPAMELGSLGIPSGIGYLVGRSQGLSDARAGLERPTGLRAKDVLGGFLVPGYTGYQIGRRGAMKDYEEAQKKAKTASSVMDITGQRPRPKIKTAQPENDNDYAVVLPDGSRHYPITSWDLVKKAEVYFGEESMRMQPEIRRQFATKLAAKACAIGYPLDEGIFEAGSTSYAAPGHLKAAVEMRKIACAPGHPREWLDELFEKHASLEPGVYVECLRRFDVEQGLDRGWDHIVLDPWASTFGINKIAEVVWESGAERVTDEALHVLATNYGDDLKDQFTEDFVNEFQKDPVALFNSMPDPQKKILSRMANDSASYGGSEQSATRSPTGKLEGHKKAL